MRVRLMLILLMAACIAVPVTQAVHKGPSLLDRVIKLEKRVDELEKKCKPCKCTVNTPQPLPVWQPVLPPPPIVCPNGQCFPRP